jgi:hypothetical protein
VSSPVCSYRAVIPVTAASWHRAFSLLPRHTYTFEGMPWARLVLGLAAHLMSRCGAGACQSRMPWPVVLSYPVLIWAALPHTGTGSPAPGQRSITCSLWLTDEEGLPGGYDTGTGRAAEGLAVRTGPTPLGCESRVPRTADGRSAGQSRKSDAAWIQVRPSRVAGRAVALAAEDSNGRTISERHHRTPQRHVSRIRGIPRR